MTDRPRYHTRMRTVPWVVPGANTFLRTYTAEHPGCDVLEFGGGASTIWFLREGCHIVSYEDKRLWTELIQDAVNNRDIVSEEQAARLDLRPWEDDIPDRLAELFDPDSFDIILVDDLKRWECLHGSVPLVRPGGVMMLDNSGTGNIFPEWEWTYCVQGAPDEYNVTYPTWKPGWATAWWQRPSPLTEAVYHDVFSEHKR